MKEQTQMNPWREYELRKRELRKLNLSSDQFREKINQILNELDL